MKSLYLSALLLTATALSAHAEEHAHAAAGKAEAGKNSHAAPHAAPHWEYGASNWGSLSADFAVCGEGTAQSPIDVDGPMESGLAAPQFAYEEMELEVLNNGHTIQVNAAPGSKLKTGMGESQLVQFHFHTPSEHFMEGKRYPLEMHLVHKNEEGALSVVGVFFQVGEANPVLTEILSNAPAEPGSKHSAFSFNPQQLIAPQTGYVRYAGSLTTPPCAEQVSWYVTTQPLTASAQQIAQFNGLMSNNARPLQPRNNRLMIRSSTHTN